MPSAGECSSPKHQSALFPPVRAATTPALSRCLPCHHSSSQSPLCPQCAWPLCWWLVRWALFWFWFSALQSPTQPCEDEMESHCQVNTSAFCALCSPHEPHQLPSLVAWVERALRLFFLAVIAGPLTFMVDYFFFQWPVLTMLCVLYSIPYSDLSEQNGGKVSMFCPFLFFLLQRGVVSSRSCSNKQNPRLRKCLMWGMMRSYFWLELVRTCPLDPTKQYIFAIHPHGGMIYSSLWSLCLSVCLSHNTIPHCIKGILPFGSTAAMCSEHKGGFNDLFPGINFKTLVATFGFYIPLYRGIQLCSLFYQSIPNHQCPDSELMLYTGMVDASRFSAKKLLDEKMSIALVPGGATEALYVSPDKDVLFLKKRKGFIKLGKIGKID